MNIQVTASHSDFSVFKSRSRPSTLRVTPPDVFILRTEALKLTLNGAPFYQRKILPNSYLSSSYKRCPPVCFFGGKGRPENADEASPWKSIEKGMGKLKKEQSVEDALRQQIEKQEYYDDGGSGANRSGGGGRGDRGGGSGGSGDGGFWECLDELLQFILALSGLLLVYFYLLDGEDWPYIVRDYIKAFIFLRKKSYRLKRNMEWCAKRYRAVKKIVTEQFKSIYETIYPPWEDGRSCFPYPLAPLASEIANTPTYWDTPMLYYALSPSRLKSKKAEDGSDDDSDEEPDDSDEETDDSDEETDDSDTETDDSDTETDASDKEPDGSDKENDDSDKEPDGSDKEPDEDYYELEELSELDEELFNELDKEDEDPDKEEEDDYFEPYLLEDSDDDDKGKEEEEEDVADRLLSELPKIDMAAVERIVGDVSAGKEDGDRLDIPVRVLEDVNEKIEGLKPERGVKPFTRSLGVVKIKRKRKVVYKEEEEEEEESVGEDSEEEEED